MEFHFKWLRLCVEFTLWISLSFIRVMVLSRGFLCWQYKVESNKSYAHECRCISSAQICPTCPMFHLNPYDRAVYLEAYIRRHSILFSPCGLDIEQSLRISVCADMTSWKKKYIRYSPPSLALSFPSFIFHLLFQPLQYIVRCHQIVLYAVRRWWIWFCSSQPRVLVAGV